MKTVLVVVGLLALSAGVYSQVKSYHGYKTYRVVAETEEQLNLLKSLSKDDKFDFWSKPRSLGKDIDVMVSPEEQREFSEALSKYGVQSSVLIDNVQNVVDREDEEMRSSRKFDGKIAFTQYYEYDDMVAYMKQLQQQYPNLVKVRSIGKTYEGRDINALEVSSGGNGAKKAVFIEGGIHAREWIAPTTILYLINQLVENSTNSNLYADLDWLLVPVTNPDGYSYTRTNDRLWRKNRNKVNALCKGADANRNFGFHWGGEGASTSPCDETYRGAAAFSEAESSSCRDYATENGGGDRIKVYLAMHSYGPYFLYPWGYQWDLPEDWEDLDTLARDAVKAIKNPDYEIGSSTQLLYAAAGGSDDYMKGGQGIKYAYTVELPGGGSAGFNPPPSSILPVAKETFEGYKVIAKTAAAAP